TYGTDQIHRARTCLARRDRLRHCQHRSSFRFTPRLAVFTRDGCSPHRTGLHRANSRLSGKRTGNFVNLRGRATTWPRTYTRHFRRFGAKFPVGIELGILLSNREFFLPNREISSAKTRNQRAHALYECLPGKEKRASPAQSERSLLE